MNNKDLQELEAQKNRLNADDNKLNKKLNDSKTLLSTIESKITAHNQQVQAIETNKTLNESIDNVKADLKTIEKDLQTKNDSIADITANKRLAENSKIKYEKAIEKLKDLEVKAVIKALKF